MLCGLLLETPLGSTVVVDIIGLHVHVLMPTYCRSYSRKMMVFAYDLVIYYLVRIPLIMSKHRGKDYYIMLRKQQNHPQYKERM